MLFEHPKQYLFNSSSIDGIKVDSYIFVSKEKYDEIRKIYNLLEILEQNIIAKLFNICLLRILQHLVKTITTS